MKRIVLAIMIALIMGATTCPAGEIPTFPFVFVSGQAEKEVPPDVATIAFTIEAFDEDPAKALTAIEQRSSQVMALFKKYGIENKDVVAYEIRKEAVRERKDYVALRIVGYEITRPISAKLRKLDKFDVLMTSLVELKNVSKVRAAFDVTKRKEIEADLFRQAAQKARERADLLARGFGTEVLSVHAIAAAPLSFRSMDEELGMGTGAANYRFSAAAPAASKERSMNLFVPDSIKLHEAVNAIFRLR